MVADGSGEIGAAKLTGEVLQIMQSVPQLVKTMTGVDITTQMPRVGGISGRVRMTTGLRIREKLVNFEKKGFVVNIPFVF